MIKLQIFSNCSHGEKSQKNNSTIDNIFCLPEISKINREKRKIPQALTLNCFACSHFKEDKNI